MSFEKIAKDVIKKSIRSAVCIDDMFVQPYMSDQEVIDRNAELSTRDGSGTTLNFDIPKELYSSFREVGICDLDIYNFKSFEESWKPDYMLSNKDLLVIDWELEGKNNYSSTLKILSEAILGPSYPSTPFIIIYTYEPKENFDLILQELVSTFYPLHNRDEIETQIVEKIISVFETSVEEELDNELVFDWVDNSHNLFFEFWFNTDSDIRESLIVEFSNSFNSTFSISEKKANKSARKLVNIIKEVFQVKDTYKAFEQLYYLSVKSSLETISSFNRIDSKDLGIRINNTVLTIFSKENGNSNGIKPEEVFDTFSEMVVNDPHNFLTLLSLEIKDRLRDDLSAISEKITSLDERAFFHHMNTYKERSTNYKNEFFDFLLKGWLDEMETYNLNNLPEIFSTIDEYIGTHNYSDIKGYELKKEIGELGLKFSTVQIHDRLDKAPTLMFGDIFYESKSKKYYLCITPTCVCVDTSKVDNNLYFIRSSDYKPFVKSSAVKSIETDYYSIVNHQSDLLAIKWDCKPFTLYIKNNDLNSLNTYYSCEPITLEYVTSSKENFTQRIANQSFSYGTSIGIDLPHI